MREAPLRDRIAAILDRLTPAERKVAQLVAAEPGTIPDSTLASLARAAGVSEPTVIRFCRALGLEGFAGLRLAVVRAEAGGTLPAPRAITPGLPAGEAAAAVLEGAISTLDAALRMLDGALVARAALALLRAARVEIWATGTSFPAARHLEAALLGLCRGVAARDDGAMQALAAATLDGDAVVLCVCRSGADREVVAAARIAAEAGATVVAITRPRSPLAALATLTLPCEAQEGGTPGNPAAILQLALAEGLASAASLLAPPVTPARLQRIAAARHARRIET
ncbi:MAG TPA: MurR/RpiR family transcriptional regulator [Falsiroseomonas sp.]|jgi:RpiR family carbohydrate utilization transcriptional regulator|nr:MurR/RpiR family transcriptional regulator [Falsiroseomonas sp.]